MTINRVRNTGWQKKTRFTSSECTQLDENCSYAVDKRDGYSDTISSTLTQGEGTMIFASGSDFLVNDADDVDFAGVSILKLGTVIKGSEDYEVPLAYGVTEVDLTSNYTLTESDWVNPIIKLTGSVTESKTLTLPSVIGAHFYIDNQVEEIAAFPTTDTSYQFLQTGLKDSLYNPILINIKTASGNSYSLKPKESATVYIDSDLDVLGIGKEKEYDLVCIHAQQAPDGYAGIIQILPSSSDQQFIDGYYFYDPNPQAGDIYEASCVIGLETSGQVGFYDFVAFRAPYSIFKKNDFSEILSNTTNFSIIRLSSTFQFISGDFFQLEIRVYNTVGDFNIRGPLNFVVKKYKAPIQPIEVYPHPDSLL